MSKFQLKDRKLEERYLTMVGKALSDNKMIKFIGSGQSKIKQTKKIKAFLSAILNSKQLEIDSLLMDGNRYSPIFISTDGEEAYTWSDIDKSQFSGVTGVKKSDAKTTRLQELASMYAIEQGLNKNGYKSRSKFLTDCHKTLKEIYPDMDFDWEETFFQQQKVVSDEVPSNTNFNYSRDDGFMDNISNLVKEFGISKKDSWNPADIWLVEKPANRMKELAASKTIAELNEKMRFMFETNKVVGISLKKMSGKTARWELVNVDKSLFDNMPTFRLGDIRCHMSGAPGSQKGASTDSVMNINHSNDAKVVATFQIRQNSKGFNNLKVEGTQKGATAARLGKVPLDMLSATMRQFGITLNNKHQNYPKSLDKFMAKQAYWQRLFNKVNPHCETNIKNNEFIDSMTGFYGTSPDIAMSKLMQLDFISKAVSLETKKADGFATSIYFLAQKKGNVFGPFGKLY
jgi:hypothetical protein